MEGSKQLADGVLCIRRLGGEMYDRGKRTGVDCAESAPAREGGRESGPARSTRTRATSSTFVGYRIAQSSILTSFFPLAAARVRSRRMLIADSELVCTGPYLRSRQYLPSFRAGTRPTRLVRAALSLVLPPGTQQ